MSLPPTDPEINLCSTGQPEPAHECASRVGGRYATTNSRPSTVAEPALLLPIEAL